MRGPKVLEQGLGVHCVHESSVVREDSRGRDSRGRAQDEDVQVSSSCRGPRCDRLTPTVFQPGLFAEDSLNAECRAQICNRLRRVTW